MSSIEFLAELSSGKKRQKQQLSSASSASITSEMSATEETTAGIYTYNYAESHAGHMPLSTLIQYYNKFPPPPTTNCVSPQRPTVNSYHTLHGKQVAV